MSEKYTGFQRRVMELFYLADVREDLLWHVTKDDGELHLSADVSDIFDWASADSEDITPETLSVLEKAYEDLEAVDGTAYLADLYGARMRQQRPQGAAYPEIPEVIELLNACGPPRERDLSNPRHPPEPLIKLPAAVLPPMDPEDVVEGTLVLDMEPEMYEQLGRVFGAKTYPYEDGEFTVLGPEIFASADGQTLCWKGENYTVQEPSLIEFTTDPDLKGHYRTAIRTVLVEALGEGPWDVVLERCANAVMEVRDTEMGLTEIEMERRGRVITSLQGQLQRERAGIPERAQAAIRSAEEQAKHRDMLLDEIREYARRSDDDGITTRERVLSIVGLAEVAHRYLSTSCFHGEHAYCQAETGAVGEKVPAQCKFCAAPCRCVCHRETPQKEG